MKCLLVVSLRLQSNWLLVSPYNITLKSNRKVTRIKEMITTLRSSRLSNKFSLSVPRDYREDSVENMTTNVRVLSIFRSKKTSVVTFFPQENALTMHPISSMTHTLCY